MSRISRRKTGTSRTGAVPRAGSNRQRRKADGTPEPTRASGRGGDRAVITRAARVTGVVGRAMNRRPA
jgi:hypothetical protein